jgi:hypothetical protein
MIHLKLFRPASVPEENVVHPAGAVQVVAVLSMVARARR